MSDRAADPPSFAGGSGFLASHVLDQLLKHGLARLWIFRPASRLKLTLSSFEVVVTIRSSEKGQRIIDTCPETSKQHVSYVVVKDITRDGAFDEAVQSEPPFDYIIDTASPYHLNARDPVRDFLDPAIKGTTGIFHSVRTQAPRVKRVVFTSSSAAILNPDILSGQT